MTLRSHSDYIIERALAAAKPDAAVRRALESASFGPGRLVVVAVGKAAWQMAHTAYEVLGPRLHSGIVISKYDHLKGGIGNFALYEAGHPIPDQNSIRATAAAIQLVSGLSAADTVLFLLSGGGSALFEQPQIPLAELQDITAQLLTGGADIVEINTIRKRLSTVKGGRFAELAQPAQVFSVVLSDIIGDPLDMIASGPTFADASTSTQALAIAQRYRLRLSPAAEACLQQETPKQLPHAQHVVAGNVELLCRSAAASVAELGYRPIVLTDSLCCQAKEAGSFFAAIARYHQHSTESLAFIAGGETVVVLQGSGLGGRNQELALAAAEGLHGLAGTALFSVGSDGSDGPTDAAGGYVDGSSRDQLLATGRSVYSVLQENDAYHALADIGGLIRTGPTGTNVNDLTVLLIKR